MVQYLVHIDGNPRAVCDTLEDAKARALQLADGSRAMLILVAYGGPIPNEAWYFDYEEKRFRDGDWVHTPDPHMAEPKAKST